MLRDLANDGGYVALKRAAEIRGDDDIERMSETCFTAEHLLTDNVTRTRSRNLESGALNLVCQRFCLRACV